VYFFQPARTSYQVFFLPELGYARYFRLPTFGKKGRRPYAFGIDRAAHLARHSRGEGVAIRFER